jgi:hypothetical protein
MTTKRQIGSLQDQKANASEPAQTYSPTGTGRARNYVFFCILWELFPETI